MAWFRDGEKEEPDALPGSNEMQRQELETKRDYIDQRNDRLSTQYLVLHYLGVHAELVRKIGPNKTWTQMSRLPSKLSKRDINRPGIIRE